MLEAKDPDEQPVIPARSNAYRDVLAERGIAFDPAIVVQGIWGSDFGATAMSQLLSLPDPPTAVFAHSDEVAAGAIKTLRRTSLRIPEDMSIVGIDDHPLADYLDLTTARQDPYLQGVQGARQLIQRLAGEPSRPEIATTQLIVRRSTSPPRRSVGGATETRAAADPITERRS
jgi:DNA-binding LacI/PurR family transcriptional regulator